MKVHIPDVETFPDAKPDKAQALKMLEEASEVHGAWQRYDYCCDFDGGDPAALSGLVDECADVIQATCNLLASLGVTDMSDAMQRCYDRNKKRGRFEHSVLDADGVEIRKGDTVWHVETGWEYVVVEPSYGETVVVRLAEYDDAEGEQYAPEKLTHKRPVFAADGLPLREGETVWHVDTGGEFTVLNGAMDAVRVPIGWSDGDSDKTGMCAAASLTHERPVLAADGLPLREGETVYDVKDRKGFEQVVTSTELDGMGHVKTRSEKPVPSSNSIHPSRLTHERPDSWERLEEDMGDDMARMQCGPISPETACASASEFVRRAKRLAEVDE